MAEVVLFTGGARSGKSGYAQKLAEALAPPRIYLATCPSRIDEEMDGRIGRHRAARENRGWQTVEEPLSLADALRHADGSVVLVDCIALWVANIMWDTERRGGAVTEEAVGDRARQVLDAARGRQGLVLIVTNEVGQGIVPDNVLGRRYRDLLGRVNQELAAGARTVVLMTCGLPLVLKGCLPVAEGPG